MHFWLGTLQNKQMRRIFSSNGYMSKIVYLRRNEKSTYLKELYFTIDNIIPRLEARNKMWQFGGKY